MEKRISVKLETHWIETLDDVATYSRISRHNMMQNIVQIALKEIKAVEQIGFFKIGLVLDEMTRTTPIYTLEYQVKPIPLTIAEENLVEIDRVAEGFDCSRHMLLCKLIMAGIYELNKPEYLGRFSDEDFRDYLHKKFHKIAQNGEKAFSAVFT